MNLTICPDIIHATTIPVISLTQAYYSKAKLQFPQIFPKNKTRTLSSDNINLFNNTKLNINASFSPKFPTFIHSFSSSPSKSHLFHHQSYSSSLSDTDFLPDKTRDAWKSVIEKVEEACDEFSAYAKTVLDTNPYLCNVIIPVGGTLTAALIAWIVMPRMLRKLHKCSMQSPAKIFLEGSISDEQIPYEKSFWGSLEDPVRYLVTFMAFSQM